MFDDRVVKGDQFPSLVDIKRSIVVEDDRKVRGIFLQKPHQRVKLRIWGVLKWYPQLFREYLDEATDGSQAQIPRSEVPTSAMLTRTSAPFHANGQRALAHPASNSNTSEAPSARGTVTPLGAPIDRYCHHVESRKHSLTL